MSALRGFGFDLAVGGLGAPPGGEVSVGIHSAHSDREQALFGVCHFLAQLVKAGDLGG